MRSWSLGVALAAVVGASGCGMVAIGKDFELRAFAERVQHGVTTQAQVHAWLGAPMGKGVAVDASGERFEEWSYYYGRGRLPGLADATLKTLQVRFDRAGLVRSYTWSSDE